jgi:hypothetical protein
MSPQEVLNCTLWEFAAASHGWSKANNPDAQGETSQAEMEELGSFLDSYTPRAL